MNLDADDFELLGVARRFAQDRPMLDSRWREMQAQVHPDRFVAQGTSAQRVAMQWAVRVNEAYQRLKDPLKRAAYLCELNGVSIEAESNTAMPQDFLMQQMAWREALDDASSWDAVQALDDEVSGQRAAALARLHDLIDVKGDFGAAAQQVRALMFIDRFAEDIARRLDALGQ